MARYDIYGDRDTSLATIGDRGFRGVNMRLEPELLAPGYVSEAVNMRFRAGIAETRGGLIRLAWAQKITGTALLPWGNVQAAVWYSDPVTTQDYMVIAAAGAAYALRQSNTYLSIPMPGAETAPDGCTFTQCFSSLIMWRGTTQSPLVMTSTTVGFALPVQTPTGIGALAMPWASRGIFVGGRLWTFVGDTVYASDALDYTRYAPLNTWRINMGTADGITALYKFNDNTILVFKERSIYSITGVSNPDDGAGNITGTRVDPVTLQYGTPAPDSIQQVGADLWFYTWQGTMSLRQTVTNNMQSGLIPTSEPVLPLTQRIAAKYIRGLQSALWDSKYYLAVPLDAAEGVRTNRITALFPSGAWPFNWTITDLTVGRKYRWVRGDASDQLTCGATTLTQSGDFVASATTAVVRYPTQAGTDPGQVFEVWSGVNTAVLVYDFMSDAWCGLDQSAAIEFKLLVKFKHLDKERIFAVSSEGWIYLYEEGSEDHMTTPYSDVLVSSVPAVGDTITVNGGTTVIVTAGASDATHWQAGVTVSNAKLYLYGIGLFGYGGHNATQWSSPNAYAVAQDPQFTTIGALRFYSKAGTVPAVVTTGSWATITEAQFQAIPSYMITRGYIRDENVVQQLSWVSLHIQTQAPSYTLTAQPNGVNEDIVTVKDRTKSRVNYYKPWDRPPWDPSNVNDDFLTAYREDYSVEVGTASGYSATLAIGSGVRTDLHQETIESFYVSETARSVRMRVDNKQGRIRVMRSSIDSIDLNIKAGIEV